MALLPIMSSFAGPLRNARSEVMPHIPELAPDLAQHPTVILDALTVALQDQGVDPQKIPAADLNKVERYTLAGFAINELRAFTLTGTGSESTFKNFKQRSLPLADPKDNFKYSLFRHQRSGSHKVADYYTYGPTERHQWWPLAQHRYRKLGWAAFKMAEEHPAIPVEGLGLKVALHTLALGTNTKHLADFIRTDLHAPVDERVQAAHDLSHIPASMAGVHFLQLLELGNIPKAKIAKDENGVYRATFWPAHRSWIKQDASKVKRLPNTVLKCPAHVTPVEALKQVESNPLEITEKPDTNLHTFVHATINALADAGMFERQTPGAWSILKNLVTKQ